MKSIIAFAFLFATWGCVSEKKGLEPGVDQRVTAHLGLAFEEENLEKVPYQLDFKGLMPAEDYDFIFYKTMGEARLFFPDSVVSDDAKARKKTQELPVLVWQAEDQKVEAFLNKMQADEYISLFKQECARGMIARTNLLDDESAAAKAAIAKYVDMIGHEGLYSPGLVYYSLKRLKGTWSPDQISGATRQQLAIHPKFESDYDQAVSEIDAKPTLTESDVAVKASLRAAKIQNKTYISRLKDI